MPTSDDAPEASSHEVRRDVRLVVGTIVLVLLVVFAVKNRADTRVDWVVGDGSAPLAVLLAVAAVAGALIGWLLLHRPHRHTRQR